MQERFPINENPKGRRLLGYVTRLYRDFISGGDAFFTLVKAGITITCIASIMSSLGSAFSLSALSFSPATLKALSAVLFGAVLPAAPYIIGATVVGGLIYLAFGYYDERDRNKEEDQKLKDLETATWRKHYVTAEVQKHLQDPGETKLADLKTSGDLLKYLLYRYLQKVGLYDIEYSGVSQAAKIKRKSNGALPSQDGMLSLIEKVSGFSRHDSDFTVKMSLFLDKYQPIEVKPDFNDRLITAFNLQRPKKTPEAPITIDPVPKNKGGFRGVITNFKSLTLALGRSNTGFGLIIWTSVVLGILVIGGPPISFPILALSLTVGLLSGASSYFYKRVVERNYKKNTNAIKEETEEHKTHYEMLYKLHHLQDKNYEKPKDGESKHDSSAITSDEVGRGLESPEQIQARKAAEAIKNRAKKQVILHTTYGATIGAVIGIAISSVFAIFFGKTFSPAIPMMAVNLPGLIMAGIFGLRFGRQMGKATAKASAAEIASLNRILDKEKAIKVHIIKDKDLKHLPEHHQEELLKDVLFIRLEKSTQELVAELMQNFIKLNGEKSVRQVEPCLPTTRPEIAGLLTKKEKVLCAIEAATKVRRPVKSNELPDNLNPEFYNKLSSYLQENGKVSVETANKITSEFRRVVTGHDQDKCMVTFERPSLTRLQKIKNTYFSEGINKTFQRHIAPALGAAGIGIPLGFMLFGSFALPLMLMVSFFVIGVYSVNKYFEVQQKAHLDAITEKETKLNLIGRSVKLAYKVEQLQEKQPTKPAPPPPPVRRTQKSASFIIPGIFSRPHTPDISIGPGDSVALPSYSDHDNRGNTSQPENRFRSEIGPIAAARTFGGHSYFPGPADRQRLARKADEIKRVQSAAILSPKGIEPNDSPSL